MSNRDRNVAAVGAALNGARLRKGKVVTAVVGLGGVVEISACCLATDSWQDHQYFLAEATRLEKCDKRGSNRSLRASLLFLFSHLEGVVNQIYLERGYAVMRGQSLLERAEYVHSKAHAAVSPLKVKMWKAFRDIIAHPGISKFLGKDKITENSIYRQLSIIEVTQASALVSQWLDATCLSLNISRFTDTAALVKAFSSQLGTSEGIEEI